MTAPTMIKNSHDFCSHFFQPMQTVTKLRIKLSPIGQFFQYDCYKIEELKQVKTEVATADVSDFPYCCIILKAVTERQ